MSTGPDPDAGTIAAAGTFQALRPRLFGIAYRMLGSAAEADDVVQDAWLRWQTTDRSVVRDPSAFLITTTTRLAINVARSARARREAYVGPWLPEPVDTTADPALGAERDEAIAFAVLLLLGHLAPVERAAFVLREAFDYPYARIGEIIERSEPAVRQLVSRARRRIGREGSRPVAPEAHRHLLDAFVAAARVGDLAGLERVLAADVVSTADGNGQAGAAIRPIFGRERVLRLLGGVVERTWGHGTTVRAVDVNGQPAALLERAGAPFALLAISIRAGRIDQLYWVMAPAKLGAFHPDPIG